MVVLKDLEIGVFPNFIYALPGVSLFIFSRNHEIQV